MLYASLAGPVNGRNNAVARACRQASAVARPVVGQPVTGADQASGPQGRARMTERAMRSAGRHPHPQQAASPPACGVWSQAERWQRVDAVPPEMSQHGRQQRAVALVQHRLDEACRHRVERQPDRLDAEHDMRERTDFYFVVGEKLAPNQAQAMTPHRLTPAQLRAYATVGGAPSLDGQYTVFGEVTEGQDVVDKISQVPVESDKWPVQDILLRVEVVK